MFPRIHPTEKEIEKCKTCKNAFLKCQDCCLCWKGHSQYEKEEKSGRK